LLPAMIFSIALTSMKNKRLFANKFL